MSSTKDRLHRAFGLDMAAQADLTDVNLDLNVNLEVICIGLSQTGTTSLQAAFTTLGFAPTHHGVDLFRSMERTNNVIDLNSKVLSGAWKAGDSALTDCLRELMRGYRSCADLPIYPLIKEVYAAYPDAKYILTTRPDGATEWYHIISGASWDWRHDWCRTWFRFCIYPVYFLRRTDDNIRLTSQVWRAKYGTIGPEMYDRHNALVTKLVPKEQLLVYDVREGWKPLCKFLEVLGPNEKYPNLNDSQSLKALCFGMIGFGLFYWTLCACAVAGLAYVTIYPEIWKHLLGYVIGWA